MNPSRQPLGRFLKRSEVEREVGLKRSAIYDRIAAGTFPRGQPIGRGQVRWRETEIEKWKRDQLKG
jgi:prophage regulatory protein